MVVPEGEGTSEAAIMGALGDKIAKFKQPKKVILLPELPRNTMGKVQKKTLREDYAGCLPDFQSAPAARVFLPR